MAHRYDRTGDRIEGAEQPQPIHDTSCLNGWLGEDLKGRMVPCLVCKPHLAAYFLGRWPR